MAQIKIYSDTQKGCIFFDNSTVEPKFIGTIVAQIKEDENDRIRVYRTDRVESDGVTFRTLFKRLNPRRVQNLDGQDLMDTLGYTVLEVVNYINEQASNFQTASAARPDLDDHPNFALDATGTSIMVDNGESFGVNTIKAILGDDGLIDIVSSDFSGNAVTYYEDCPHDVFQIRGESVTGGPSDVVNKLNELFVAGPFEAVVISDPYATMVADVAGEDAGYTLEGDYAVDPVGADIMTTTATHNNKAGLKSVATIDQAGEYFTFDIRGEGQIGFGLIHTDDSYADGYYSGNGTYANPASFANGVNSAHYGFQFSHWFHPTPNGSWTNYGANTGYSMRPGWSNWDQRDEWLAGNPVKMRVGLDTNGYISIDSLQDDGTWVAHARSSYPAPQGSSYHLGINVANSSARVFSAPKVHLLEPEAPTMYFRYIESPDGNFEYPLFSTPEEADYYDMIVQGSETGASHTHTYEDDPTNTTWYMPDHLGVMNGTEAPTGQTFNGQPITYTEITSLTDADLAPPTPSFADLTYQEGTVVNMQLQPADTTYSTSASVSPAGSGLVYNNTTKMLQGTLSDVASDTTYTVTVTRGNSYGSRTGTFTITSTNVAPVSTNSTSWNKAIDFSGNSERAEMVSSNTADMPLAQTASTTVTSGTDGQTSTNTNARPWAVSCVFKIDGNSSNQHIWNQGEGAGSNDDNIYLRVDSAQNLYFGWGRSGAVNEVRILTSISSAFWYGVYIAFDGRRYAAAGSTPGNLYRFFDIYTMSSHDNFTTSQDNGNYSAWSQASSTTGARMDRSITGRFSVGGRGSNRNFHGKIASCVTTTLKLGQAMPTQAEAEMMITDPMQWIQDYKVDEDYRQPNSHVTTNNWYLGNTAAVFYPASATQVWLMGDGVNDSYSNMIRNRVNPTDQNHTKMNMYSMVSSDIQNVTIPGLS